MVVMELMAVARRSATLLQPGHQGIQPGAAAGGVAKGGVA
jgi:hypothetical protein